MINLKLAKYKNGKFQRFLELAEACFIMTDLFLEKMQFKYWIMSAIRIFSPILIKLFCISTFHQKLI
jgi:hypothetical protein